MRILHIHTKMVAGGIEAMVCSLANEMSKKEDVTVCTIFQPSGDDIFYRKLSESVNKETIGKVGYGFSIKEPYLIYRFIKNGGYDIVHFHGCFQYYFLAVLLLHKKLTFIYTIHSDARMENQKWDKRLLFFKRFCFKKRWIKPVTISKTSQVSFERFYGCSSYMIPNGIQTSKKIKINDKSDLSIYRDSNSTRIFIHPGRISKAKNQVVLCKSFFNIQKEGYPAKLIIAGFPEEQSIYQEMQKYFSDGIIYLGERDDILALLSQADGFCLPSIWEGLPVSLLEAISVGCIPICSPVGGMIDVVKDGYNGVLSKSPSEEDYTDALRRFMGYDDERLLTMRRNAKETFSGYKIETTAQKYINYYLQHEN